MEANNFIMKLKADGTKNDEINLDKVYKEYHSLLTKIQSKERGTFSLNVLCILCRNLDKVPSWRENIDNKSLLMLSIDCVRETRGMDKANHVKTLACIYHLHKHVVRQTTPLPPELVLKISIMAFESKELIAEYSKTYWNIIVDRISYIEMLKDKVSITKLLPKLTEDILHLIEIYDTVHLTLCLNSMFKKLFYLFSDKCCADLNNVYIQIFDKISKKSDLKVFKKLQHKELLDLYGKLNDCMYIVTENCIKDKFRNYNLENIVRIGISLIGHSPDIFHCFQTFYLNGICCILKETNQSYIETILSNMLSSFDTTEKLGYTKAVYTTYPFLGQFLKLYIEYAINNKLSEEVQVKMLEIIQHLMKKLKYTEQLAKCENCNAKTGLHDALRISFQAKNLITTSIEKNLDLNTTLPLFYSILKEQYVILTQLGQKGCTSFAKCFRKLQTDVHNTAILLNNAKLYAYSKKLFEVYLKNEILHFKNETEMKNIARALYNKSICELDSKSYNDALIDAFLSQIFGQDLNTDKYMSLVMDIKAKAYKNGESDVSDDLQLMTVVEACNVALKNNLYGNLRAFFTTLKFCDMLKQEFLMYARLWPSVVPIAGIWSALLDLYKGNCANWMTGENQQEILNNLLEIVLETPSVVRTVQSEHFSKVIIDLISILEHESISMDFKVAYATLLFLKSEFDFAEAGIKYGWKMEEQNMNPDEFKAIRTYQQEFACLRTAISSVEMWSGLVKKLKHVTKTSWLVHALAISEIYVQQLLRLSHVAHGLQLAHICCQIADSIGDKLSYIRNAGAILYYMDRNTEEVINLLTKAGDKYKGIVKTGTSMEAAIIFMCDWAIFSMRCGWRGTAAKLVLHAQAHLLTAQETTPQLNLDLAIGRLLEAQMQLCPDTGPSCLTKVNMVQRHYLLVVNNATKWTLRRLRALTIKHHTITSSLRAVRLSRALLAWRRARSASGAALPAAGAHAQATLFSLVTNVWKVDDAQIEIDNRLKYILGLQPTNDTQPEVTKKSPDVVFTPRPELETMRDCLFLKKTQSSPSLPCNTVQAFKVPEFLLHDSRCRCYGCQTPSCPAMTVRTFCLEASMYFRAKELTIAENYFAGVFKILNLCEGRLKSLVSSYRGKVEEYLLDFVGRSLFDELKMVNLQVLLDASHFELAKSRYDVVDSYIVNMHEILQDLNTVDDYLKNDISNLMTASAYLRHVVRKPADLGIEDVFENLTLSPAKDVEIVKTPESKRLPVDCKSHKVVVNDEEIPKKRRIIAKFNLDEIPDEKETKMKVTDDFKVPTLAAPRHALEIATPVPENRLIPRLLLTQASQDTPPMLNTAPKSLHSRSVAKNDVTPKPRIKLAKQTQAIDTPKEFFTPKESPEQFFTPMTSAKTYSKIGLRGNIVKNLEKELYEKENIREVNDREIRSRMKENLDKDTHKENVREARYKKENSKEGASTKRDKFEKNERELTKDVSMKDVIDKENVKIGRSRRENLEIEKGCLKDVRSRKKALQRATSPGKLPNEKRQLRKPKMNLEE